MRRRPSHSDVDPAATLFDDVHRAGSDPLADDHVALAILDRFQVGEQVVQSFGREFREDGELPEEELQVAEAGLKLEKLAHFGPPPEERVEDRSIEADHLHVPAALARWQDGSVWSLKPPSPKVSPGRSAPRRSRLRSLPA